LPAISAAANELTKKRIFGAICNAKRFAYEKSNGYASRSLSP
jgi:hypothetical protein